MSYAIKKDGSGFRAVTAPSDCSQDEFWQQEAPTGFPMLTARDQVLAAITALEANVTQRRIREAVLGADDGWLANIDKQIAALRAKLPS